MDRYRIVKIRHQPDVFIVERKGLFFWGCAFTEVVCGNTRCMWFDSLVDAQAFIDKKRADEDRLAYRPKVVWTE